MIIGGNPQRSSSRSSDKKRDSRYHRKRNVTRRKRSIKTNFKTSNCKKNPRVKNNLQRDNYSIERVCELNHEDIVNQLRELFGTEQRFFDDLEEGKKIKLNLLANCTESLVSPEFAARLAYSVDYVNFPGISRDIVNVFRHSGLNISLSKIQKYLKGQRQSVSRNSHSNRLVRKWGNVKYYELGSPYNSKRTQNVRINRFKKQLLDHSVLSTRDEKCNIITSHGDFMRELYKELYPKNHISLCNFDNLDMLHIIISNESEGQVLGGYVRKWESNYEIAKLEAIMEKVDFERAYHYFIIRHCPACHNSVPFLKKLWANMGRRGKENASIGMSSMCLKGTYDDFYKVKDSLSNLFDILEKYTVRIGFGSSIIFRAVFTCVLLICVYVDKLEDLKTDLIKNLINRE